MGRLFDHVLGNKNTGRPRGLDVHFKPTQGMQNIFPPQNKQNLSGLVCLGLKGSNTTKTFFDFFFQQNLRLHSVHSVIKEMDTQSYFIQEIKFKDLWMTLRAILCIKLRKTARTPKS